MLPTAAHATPLLGPDPLRASRRSPGKPTVCQLLHSFGLGGAELLANRLACQLSDSYRFLFVSLEQSGSLARQLQDQGFPVFVLDKRPGLSTRCALRLAHLLRRERVDLLHSHQYGPFVYGLLARLFARRPPILFTEHGRQYPDHPRRKRMLFNRFLLERRDRVVAVGEAVRQALVANEGIARERIAVIYNGIPLNTSMGARATADLVRQEIGVPQDAFVVLHVARLDPLKDHATALRALRRVLVQRPNTWLVLVGEGSERAPLERLAAAQGLTGNVRFLGLRRDVPRLLGAADMVLLTSVSEGIPLALLEGMAAGLPVVSTAVGGVPEVVTDGGEGFLTAAGDDEGLARAILSLTADAGLRARLGQEGRGRVRRAFAESSMCAAYDRLYQEMLARH